MRDVRKLNLLLWALNALLILGTVAFSFRYLLRQERFLADFVVDAGADERREAPRPALSDASLRLANPVEARIVMSAGPAAQVFKAQLRGTLPSDDPKVATAFIKSAAKNVELIAYVGEPILHEGKPYEEYRGWTLSKVSKDRATFSGPGGLTQELLIDATSGPAGPAAVGGAGKPGVRAGSRAGQAYAAAQFKSKMLMQSDSRVVWQLDPDEVDWASQNAERILESDFRVSPNGGGGLRVEGVTAGSIGASRGLAAGDVVRDVNGQPLNSMQDFRALMNNPAFKQASGLRVTVERAGKPVVIEYRQMAR